MLIDKRSTFARELSIPAAGGPAKFGDSLPLSVRSNLGIGESLWLVVNVPVAAVGGTSVALELITASDEALTANIASLGTLGTFLTASMTLGATLSITTLPQAFYNTFIGLRHTTTGVFTAGKLNAFLTMEPGQWRAYANGMV